MDEQLMREANYIHRGFPGSAEPGSRHCGARYHRNGAADFSGCDYSTFDQKARADQRRYCYKLKRYVGDGDSCKYFTKDDSSANLVKLLAMMTENSSPKEDKHPYSPMPKPRKKSFFQRIFGGK